MYIWQRRDWPRFRYETVSLAEPLSRARLEQGKVLGALGAIGLDGRGVQRELWTTEAISTAAIEGEKLDLDTVRSSVMRRLGEAGAGTRANRSVDGLLDVMQDATRSYKERLDHDRLARWQSALFPGGTSGIHRIAVGKYRDSRQAMQITSGPIGKERVHYEAPRSSDVPREMGAFLAWWERTRPGSGEQIDGLLRAGIAHLWFETIHPFEDGNGRVGRALIDLALAQDADRADRYCSLSTQLMAQREAYYGALNAAQKGSVDVTGWLSFFLDQYCRANAAAAKVVDVAVQKFRYWREHAPHRLNARQQKVLSRLLDAGPGGFEGGMSTEKYSKLVGAPKVTASRDLADLLEQGFVVATGQGRATRYWVNLPGWAP